MKINGYRLIGWAVMGLSFASRASQADVFARQTTGMSSANLHPTLGVISGVASCTADSAKQIITELANQHWQDGVRNQSTLAISTQEGKLEDEDFVLVNNKIDYLQFENKEGELAY